jgi:hypothetical protein
LDLRTVGNFLIFFKFSFEKLKKNMIFFFFLIFFLKRLSIPSGIAIPLKNVIPLRKRIIFTWNSNSKE